MRSNAYPAISLSVNRFNVLEGSRIVLARLYLNCNELYLSIVLSPRTVIVIVNRYHGTRNNIAGLRGRQAVISAHAGAGQDREIATARPLKLT